MKAKAKRNDLKTAVPADITCLDCGFAYSGRRRRCPLCGHAPTAQSPRDPAPTALPSARRPRSAGDHIKSASSVDSTEEFRLAPITPRPKFEAFPSAGIPRDVGGEPAIVTRFDRIKEVVDWNAVFMIATLAAVFVGTIILAPGLGIPFATFVLFATGLAMGRVDLAAYVCVGLVGFAAVIAIGTVCLLVFAESAWQAAK